MALLVFVSACATGATSTPTPSATGTRTLEPTATNTSTPTVTPRPERRDCNEIRGTRYRSPAERFWYLVNCLEPKATPRTTDMRAAQATPPATPEKPPPPSPVLVTAIGDSVMLGAEGQLRSAVAGIDVHATTSTQVSTGIALLRALKMGDALGPTVVIHLGSNGTFSLAQLEEMMTVLADAELVLFVNVRANRPWEVPNNLMLAGYVPRYSNARLFDWRAASAGHPEYFWADGIHLRPEGAAAYAALIAAAL